MLVATSAIVLVAGNEGPRFQGHRQQHAEIFQDSHDAMRSLMWLRHQKSVLLCWPLFKKPADASSCKDETGHES